MHFHSLKKSQKFKIELKYYIILKYFTNKKNASQHVWIVYIFEIKKVFILFSLEKLICFVDLKISILNFNSLTFKDIIFRKNRYEK